MNFPGAPTSTPALRESALGQMYREAMDHNKLSIAFSREQSVFPEEQSANRSQMRAHKSVASEIAQRILASGATCEEQKFRMEAGLLLVRIYGKERKEEAKEYFYKTVEIAQQYLPEGFLEDDSNESFGKEIIAVYLEENINPTIIRKFSRNSISTWTPLFSTAILGETHKRIQKRIRDARENSAYTEDTPDEILQKLESVVGPVRLLIISNNSGEILLAHRIKESEVKDFKHKYHHARELSVSIFNKLITYSVIIDHGSDESINQIDDILWNDVVRGIVSHYIVEKEYVHFEGAADHEANMILYEAANTGVKNDYSAFIATILGSRKTQESGEYISSKESYVQAMDICRVVLSQYRNNPAYTLRNLPGNIDAILGGRVKREVLELVTAILLASNETMNGTGCPFGLRENETPIAVKIYRIIRAYESISRMNKNNTPKVLSTLREWGEGGFLDTDILAVFIEDVCEGRIPQMQAQKKTSNSGTSSRTKRHKVYKRYMERWYHITSIVDRMGEIYDQFRNIGADEERKKVLSSEIIKLRRDIHRIAAIRTIIILGRHEETESDVTVGSSPGKYNETLNDRGKTRALQTGISQRNLAMSIVTSPFPRSIQTAILKCQGINGCLPGCICRHVQVDDVLKNPPKDLESLRLMGYLWKFAEDDPKSLMDFILRIVSSTKNSTHYIVTHGDILRHLIVIINNLFSQNGFSATRDPVGHDMTYTYLHQGDAVIEWDLLFSLNDWKSTLDLVNTLAQEYFGEPFFNPEKRRIDLIRLHDAFLDFIHFHREKSSEKVGLFIKQLEANTLTNHFPKILKKSRSKSAVPTKKKPSKKSLA